MLRRNIATTPLLAVSHIATTPLQAMSHSGTQTAPKVYALFYDYVPDILEKRVPFRESHLALARSYLAKGKLTAAGPFTPPTGAMFIFKSEKRDVEEFVLNDIYVLRGLVTAHRIVEWNIVIEATPPSKL